MSQSSITRCCGCNLEPKHADPNRMRYVIQCAALLQTLLEWSAATLHRIRRTWVVPLAHWGGRDMVLLRDGQWVDDNVAVHPSLIQWRYDAEMRQVVHSATPDARMVRWPWLSVVAADGSDLSDFFAGLRISAGQQLPRDKALALAAHQCGVFPHGTLTIVRRDGTEETVHAYEGPNGSSGDVNYVR
jgi:hypothetical protein